MALEVIGAGFGRTGTLSLKFALEKLGFDRCYHMEHIVRNPSDAGVWLRARRGEAVDWDALFDGFRASVDWPACNHWRELAAHYPQAKVLLSLRDREAWYASVMNTIYPQTAKSLAAADELARAGGKWAMKVVWEPVFDGRMEDREHVMRVFDEHNAEVIRSVPAERLLVYRPGDGWEPLCRFLGVAVPDEPYPHVNTTEQYRNVSEHGL
jgi:hypothetical protein